MSTEIIDEEKLARLASLMRVWVALSTSQTDRELAEIEAKMIWRAMTQAEKNEAERRSEIAASGSRGTTEHEH